MLFGQNLIESRTFADDFDIWAGPYLGSPNGRLILLQIALVWDPAFIPVVDVENLPGEHP